MKEINKKDLNSDTIFEDFISEKAYKIDNVSLFIQVVITIIYNLICYFRNLEMMRLID